MDSSQVDVYFYDTDNNRDMVDAVTKGRVLYGPNKPPEPLIPGGSGTAWKLVDRACPEIDIEKGPNTEADYHGDDTTRVAPGLTHTFHITVTNTGNVKLTGVEVNDEKTAVCDRTLGPLEPEESVTYTCDTNVLYVPADGFTNIAEATGTYSDEDVTAKDPSTVTVKDSPPTTTPHLQPHHQK